MPFRSRPMIGGHPYRPTCMLPLLIFLLAVSRRCRRRRLPTPALLERARALHKRSPLIDGHNDYPWALREKAGAISTSSTSRGPQPSIMTDIPRLRAVASAGSSGRSTCRSSSQGQAAVTATLEQIDIVHQMVRRYPDDVRARADGGRRGADFQEGQDRVAHRDGRRPLDRQLARRAADVLPRSARAT